MSAPRHHLAPGHLTLPLDAPLVVVLMPHGRSLSLLQGGQKDSTPRPKPTPARKVA